MKERNLDEPKVNVMHLRDAVIHLINRARVKYPQFDYKISSDWRSITVLNKNDSDSEIDINMQEEPTSPSFSK